MRMKNALTAFMLFLMISPSAALWNDCSKADVNGSCPGACGRFIDTDDDGTCDHAQLPPEQRRPAETETAKPPVPGSAPAGNETRQETPRQSVRPVYHFVEISGGLLLFYLISAVVVKTGRLTLVTHRRIWNTLLLFSFLLSGMSGLLLVLKINYGLEIPHSFMLFWHVETGIAMAVISLFHVLWHWKYYKSMVAARKGKS